MRRITDEPPSGGHARSTTIASRASTRPRSRKSLIVSRAPLASSCTSTGAPGPHESRAEARACLRLGDVERRDALSAGADRAPRRDRLQHARSADLRDRRLELGRCRRRRRSAASAARAPRATSRVRSLLRATSTASFEPSAGAVSRPISSRCRCSASTLESITAIAASAGCSPSAEMRAAAYASKSTSGSGSTLRCTA